MTVSRSAAKGDVDPPTHKMAQRCGRECEAGNTPVKISRASAAAAVGSTRSSQLVARFIAKA